MRDFHIFNPETDLVLAADSETFTPKKGIELLRTRLALLPALYAKKGDVIIIPDESEQQVSTLPLYQIAFYKDLMISPLSKLSVNLTNQDGVLTSESRIRPWGWNKEIISRLSRYSLDKSFLPSSGFVDSIRNLSHRKMTTIFFSQFKDFFPNCSSPLFLCHPKEVEDFISVTPEFCLKAPWSSSGRGIVFSDKMPNDKIMEWASSVIEKQGGIMAEKKYCRCLDFASEWYIDKGTLSFIGLSLFECSPRGKYKGNYLFSEEKIRTVLNSKCQWNEEILPLQKKFLLKRIMPNYSGPVGIDMLADQSGVVNPCVEINLRMTMGHLAIALHQQIHQEKDERLSQMLVSLFPDNFFSPSFLL